jgi:hypothetical protein
MIITCRIICELWFILTLGFFASHPEYDIFKTLLLPKSDAKVIDITNNLYLSTKNKSKTRI